MLIDNSKILSFGPLKFAPFSGVSVIFDNPAEVSAGECFPIIESDTSDKRLELYAALETARKNLGVAHLMELYRFCPLPSRTFHVTMCDLFNVANVSFLSPSARERARVILDGLPGTIESAQMEAFGFECRVGRIPVTFEFKDLAVFGDSALVAVLQPVGEHRDAAFESIKEHRLAIDHALVAAGKPVNPPFVPHISLGYLASGKHHAPFVKECLPQWTRVVHEEADGKTIKFDRASLYGFSDMITFWRGAPIWSVGSAPSVCANGGSSATASA